MRTEGLVEVENPSEYMLSGKPKDASGSVVACSIEEQEAQAKINAQQSGQDVNTGEGRKAGRPNESGREYDSNGNWPGRNNWNKYDRK